MPIGGPQDVGFTVELSRSPSAEQAVISYSQQDSRPIERALIKCLPRKLGGQSWHAGGSDPNEPVHLTVEFKDASGNHVTTKHIDRNGNAV
ncbi:hypothetical protein B0H66DRAFT_614145 [Apodospora peruviana]|uniref:Uncharacterized protein n=1 Tax=Apodospora peruviana TaxID=516989 RepID=A0AAE0MHU1_9PEZI|nr:hypothetical protein B0H66DRAFT_614145 [Apodospora peruviana]